MKVYFQEGEKRLYEGYPETAILVVWFFRALLIAIFFSFFLIPFFAIINRSYFDNIFFYYFIIFIPILLIVFAYQIALRRSYYYYITNERVILEGGILLKKIKSVPYHKITDVSIFQNIIERALDISTVNIHTAGTGVQIPEIRFFGLRTPEKPHAIIVNELKVFKEDKRQFATYSD